MVGNNREELLEQYEDATFALLMGEYAEQEGNRLLREFETANPEMPAALDDRCTDLIHRTYEKQRRNIRLKRTLRSLTRAVTVLLIAIGLCTALVFSVEAVRIPIINLFIEFRDGFMVVNGENYYHRKPPVIDPFDQSDPLNGLIPTEYALVQFLELNNGTTAIYINGTGDKIVLTTTPSDSNLTVDTENMEYTRELYIYDCQAVFTKAGTISLVWLSPDGAMTHCLIADTLSETKMVTIAHNFMRRVYPDIIQYIVSFDKIEPAVSGSSPLDAFMPDGYTPFSSTSAPTAIYMNAEGHRITFSSFSLDGTANIDTEGAAIEDIMLAGHAGLYINKEPIQKLFWIDEEREIAYTLTATDLPFDELWRLGEQLAQYCKSK